MGDDLAIRNFLNFNIRNQTPHPRLRFLRMCESALEPRDSQLQAHPVVVDQRYLACRIKVVAIAGYPVERGLAPQREPLVEAVLVHELRFTEQKLLNSLPIDRHVRGHPRLIATAPAPRLRTPRAATSPCVITLFQCRQMPRCVVSSDRSPMIIPSSRRSRWS